MSEDDTKTPSRSPSSMRLAQWGNVFAWFALGEERSLQMRLTPDGRPMVIVHAGNQTGIDYVGPNEDPSGAVLRAIVRIAQ